ncbi:AMP-binding protein [Patulibacter sp. NPDC049589]|uniref:class I adenylate-forming enzyme family protein n=1 Tax=Patulibacter sp. NPDC049589 TaxID=3154731 RepID=UPI00343CBA29
MSSPAAPAPAPYAYDPRAYRDVFQARFTYVAGVERNAHRYARRPALNDPATGRRWTYEELWADTGRVAAGLRAAGVGIGDAVVMQLFNGPEFVLLWVAAQRLGAVAVPVNFRLAPGETAHVLDDSRPVVFAFDAALAPAAEDALARAGHDPALVVHVDAQDPSAGGRHAPFDALLGDGTPKDLPTLSAWEETTRVYTSGTTGMPKGVSLNGAVEVLSAHDVIMHFPLAPEDRTMNMSPWFHRGGLYAGGPNPVLYVGAEAVALRAFDAALTLDRVAELGLTFLIGAPTNLAMLAAEQEARPRDLATLNGIVTMGAPLDRAAALRYQRVLTPRIFNGYGLTETFWNTFLRPVDLPDHAGSAGRASTDDDVAVIALAPDGGPGSPDVLAPKDGTTIGEVAMRSVKSGYAYVHRPEEQEQRFRDGWFHSGDLATWDADEYVTIVGRKDDMIVSGGENVHPVQVEGVLEEHPGVVDAAVIGIPDARWGELVVACVVRGTPDVDARTLDEHCHGHPMLADYKRPRAYRFVDELPMTATGKKARYLLREPTVAEDAAGTLARP